MIAGKTWYVYLIECSDGSLYTGITVDLAARFAAHREGRGARSMRMHAPVRMLAAEAHSDRSAARSESTRLNSSHSDRSRMPSSA